MDIASGGFARLTPINVEAKQAFHEIAEQIKAGNAPHHAKYAFIQTQKINLDCAPGSEQAYFSATDSVTTTEPATDNEEDRSKGQYWTGYFVLSFLEPPSSGGAGWRVGRGRKLNNQSSSQQTGDVDIRLCTSERYGIRGLHWRFTHDKDGILRVIPYHSGADTVITVGKYLVAKWQKPSEYSSEYVPLTERKTYVKAGKLAYYFEFYQPSSEAELQTQRRHRSTYFEKFMDSATPPPSTAATPCQTDITIDEWVLRSHILGKGSFGQVITAIHQKDARTAAVKVITRKNALTRKYCEEEVQIAQHIKIVCEKSKALNKDRLLQLEQVLYERGNATWDGKGEERIYMLLRPLVPLTLSDVINNHFFASWSKVDVATFKFTLVKQAIEGLEFMHSHNLMHRDLKPANIGIASQDPVRLVLLDLGAACSMKATDTEVVEPGKVGTVNYMAPEFETAEGYTISADVWSLGTCIYRLFHTEHPYWPSHVRTNIWLSCSQSREAIARLHASLNTTEAHSNSIDDLIKRMLCVQPHSPANKERRISAEDALDHPSIRYVDTRLSQQGKKRYASWDREP